MKLRITLVLLFLILLGSMNNASAKAEHLYIESTHGYYNVGGEILRFDGKREFALQSYSFVSKTNGDTNQTYAKVQMTDSGNNGIVDSQTIPLETSNFKPTFYFNNDNSLQKIEWNMTLFRLPISQLTNPFNDSGFFTDISIGSRTYDRFVKTYKFSTSLEYYEYQIVDGKSTKLFVDVELSTDNNNDGRVFNTAIHIIKRDENSNVIFSYSHSIKEANTISRYLNLLDRPDYQLVPFQFAAIILVIYIYMRAVRYWKSNNFKIVRGEPDEPEKPEASEDE